MTSREYEVSYVSKTDLTTKESCYLAVIKYKGCISDKMLQKHFNGTEEYIRDTLLSLLLKGYVEHAWNTWRAVQ